MSESMFADVVAHFCIITLDESYTFWVILEQRVPPRINFKLSAI